MTDASGREQDNVVPFPERTTRPADARVEPAPQDFDAVRTALEELRREIRTRLPDPVARATAAPSELEVDWMALFDELRLRVSRFGMRERPADSDDFGMDALTLAETRPLLDWLLDRYWRVKLVGEPNIPTTGPVLFVANRSGLLPYDGVVLAHLIERARPDRPRPRFMVADWLITLPFVQSYLARIGGVRACRENADRLLRTGRSVVAFPEGAKGAAKVFRERYRLKRFGRGGIVRAALDNGVPLVPVGIVGAEEAHPILFKSHLPGRIVGLPFVPVTPTFPWLGPLGALPLPTKWVVVIGEPVALPHPDDADRETLLISRTTEAIRDRIQVLVERGLDLRRSVWE